MTARLEKQNLVARPDRVDFRDRMYQPPLRSLTDVYPQADRIEYFLDRYVNDGNILNQGDTDACTGFGLAAVVNYIYWSRWLIDGLNGPPGKEPDPATKPARVSPAMIYRNARVYDEWEGTDYGGSSCRGAMKGWFKHGVCTQEFWPDVDKRPIDGWSGDAAWSPLGAYYRVDAKSISDMQAAIFEVNAVYCSADVHSGWNKPGKAIEIGKRKLPVIAPRGKSAGGHAFALVGYTREGFIVQNSWGTRWGYRGFALLTYEDWIKNGYDAWVAALGAPMQIGIDMGSPVAARLSSLASTVMAPKARASTGGTGATIAAWTEAEAYEHSVVMGNDGKLIQRLIHATDPVDALKIVVEEKMQENARHIAIYVHGGLNSEDAAIGRARRMGPWFAANGIHPIFVIWRTGILEAIGQIGLDEVHKFEEQIAGIRARGLGDLVEGFIDKAREAFDRAFEVAAEKFIGKAVWSQMKQNAAMAVTRDAGINEFLKLLATHKKPIHLLGHSAGSIMIGHMLDAAANGGRKAKFESCGLYAPACTLDFATEHYGNALKNGIIGEGGLHIDLLTDKAEIADTVGPYGKSLLYLVSRALEDHHKTPLLGLQIALEVDGRGKEMDLDKDLQAAAYKAWVKIRDKFGVGVELHSGPKVATGRGKTIPIAHGSFDNDLKVFNASLQRVLGPKAKIREATDLTGF